MKTSTLLLLGGAATVVGYYLYSQRAIGTKAPSKPNPCPTGFRFTEDGRCTTAPPLLTTQIVEPGVYDVYKNTNFQLQGCAGCR